METDGRITPAQVKAAFQTLGHDWNPAQGDFLRLDRYADGDEWNDCCGLVAVYLASIPPETRPGVVLDLARELLQGISPLPTVLQRIATHIGVSKEYAMGFALGWDGEIAEGDEDADFLAGWDDAADLFDEVDRAAG